MQTERFSRDWVIPMVRKNLHNPVDRAWVLHMITADEMDYTKLIPWATTKQQAVNYLQHIGKNNDQEKNTRIGTQDHSCL